MGHNLNYNKKKHQYSFFAKKEPAWHGLGQIVSDALTSEEAIKAALLDYEVITCPVYAKLPEDIVESTGIKGKRLFNTFCVVRTDIPEVLTAPGKTVTGTYTPIQNREAFDFFDDIVGSKEAIFETAGALGKGERIFITAKLPTNIKLINGDDIVEKYLLLTSTHDGTGAIEALFTPVRVVCNNTLNLALNQSVNKIKIRHTFNAKERLKVGSQLLGLYKSYETEFVELTRFLATQKVTEEVIETTIAELIFTPEEIGLWRKANFDHTIVDEISTRKKNVFDDINNTIHYGIGQDMYVGTKLWVLNGISSYNNNSKNYTSNSQKFDSVFTGQGNSMLQKTLQLMLT